MATFVGVEAGSGLEAAVYVVATGADPGAGEPPTPPPVVSFLQRIYDTGLGQYVYFSRTSTDPASPALGVADTQPTNTGAFDFSTHAILAEV